MKTIILESFLGDRFGRVWELDVNNSKEACLAIAAMNPEFDAYMLNAHLSDTTFAVYHGKSNISSEEILFDTAADTIRIVPIIGGSKEGVLQTIIGAIMVVVGVVMNVYAPGTGTGVIAAGIGMMVGGVAMMLMPVAKSEEANQDGNKANKGFGGATTTVAAGNPVPILYGERLVGGFIISGEIISEDQ